MAGGNDKSLTVYAFKDQLSKLWSFTCEGAPRSIDMFNGRVLLGLKTGQVIDLEYKADGKLKPKVVMRTHCDGEVWVSAGCSYAFICDEEMDGGGELKPCEEVINPKHYYCYFQD